MHRVFRHLKNHILKISDKEKETDESFALPLVNLQGHISCHDAEEHFLLPVSCFVLWGVMRSIDQHSPHTLCVDVTVSHILWLYLCCGCPSAQDIPSFCCAVG